MSRIAYSHLIKYDVKDNKIVIYRCQDDGDVHLYTEIPLAALNNEQKTLEGVGRILGETIIVDILELRDKLI